MRQVQSKVDYYIGTIVATAREGHELLKNKPEYHEAVVDIPGVIQEVLAFPINGMNDEPRVGDPVLVTSYDPDYGSYYTYQVLKENDFIGFRASGKMIDITPDYINVGVYPEDTQFSDNQRPDCSGLANITLNNDGSLVVHTAKDITINGDTNISVTIKGNADIKVSGNSKVDVSGNSDVNVSGNATLKASGTLETDGGIWKTTNPTAIPQGNGPFNCVPYCAFSGIPHASQQC